MTGSVCQVTVKTLNVKDIKKASYALKTKTVILACIVTKFHITVLSKNKIILHVLEMKNV